MSWFSKSKKPRPTVKSKIGVFEFNEDCDWNTEVVEGKVVYTSLGSEFDTDILGRAEALSHEIDKVRQVGMEYARAHAGQVSHAGDALKLEAVEISRLLEDKFSLTFRVQEDEGWIIMVEFHHGEPVGVFAGD